MSLDVRRLTEAMSTYAEGVEMTTSDAERMQRDLHDRLDRGNRPQRRRVVLAAAAILLLVAVAAAGTLWLRRPDPTVTSGPQGAGALTGVWKFADQYGTSVLVVRGDYTATEFANVQTLVRHSGGDPRRLSRNGDQLAVDLTDPQNRPCHGSAPIVAESDGRLSLGAVTLQGPGCLSSSGPESFLTRLSPLSAATRDLPVVTQDPLMAVTDPVQLNGLWLLQGTGLVLAVDETAGPAAYLMDDDGDLEPAPDAAGSLSVGPDGAIILRSTGCGDTTLRRSEVRGQGANLTLTAVVDADPCDRFGGRSSLTWIRVF